MDPRATRAKKVLTAGKRVSDKHKNNASAARSTATRAAYKAMAEAGEEALAILSERPNRR